MSEKKHILIVEDNQDHRELLEDALKRNYRISHTESKENCLKIIESDPVDLIILDYYLNNNFSGLDILRIIIKINKYLPVIIVTAYGDEDIAVSAIKSGAIDYIRKTMDNTYINKIYNNVNKLLSNGKSKKLITEIRSFLDFIEKSKEEFIECWIEKIIGMSKNLGLDSNEIDKNKLERLFVSFIADIQNESSVETLHFLKKMIWERGREGKHLINVELFNTSFKEAARGILFKHYPKAFDYRDAFMQKIGKLVDENDLELSKEYEKIMDQSILRMRSAERLSTKYVLMRTLQHEIRQPLSYIYNSAEMLLTGQYDDKKTEMIEKILIKSKEIEKLLHKLENNSDLSLKNYSDNLPIIDLS